MNIILFDDPESRTNLLPLTYTRPVAALRVGILSIDDKWKRYLSVDKVSFMTPQYLQGKYPAVHSTDNLFVFGGLLPNNEIAKTIATLSHGEGLYHDGKLLAYRSSQAFRQLQDFKIDKSTEYNETPDIINYPWDIFIKNRNEIIKDFALITSGRKSEEITDPFTRVYAPENLFIEKGVSVKAAIINAENGPVYLGEGSVVAEGSFINGAFALCEHAVVNPGAKLRGDTTVGPFSKVGGEISNSVVQGYSNKGHDGFMGNSVIGEWCNLGADTNTSNLKNNYSKVRVWNYTEKKMIDSHQQFCGLIMGDHSKSGINTMFNTGTVVGVNTNIYGSNFPPKFVPSFSWGGSEGFVGFKMDKAIEAANAMMGRRGQKLTSHDLEIFKYIEEESFQHKS